MRNKKTTRLFAGLAAAAMVVTGMLTPTSVQAASKTATVKTQADLNAALKNTKLTQITIKTSKDVSLTVKSGDYGDVKLVINAPNATVNNKGDFKTISVKDCDVMYERGDGNTIQVSDDNSLKLVAGKKATDTNVTVSSDDAKVTVVNNGEMDTVKVNGQSAVTVRGNSDDSVNITANATGAQITTAVDASVKLNASVSLTVKAGCTLDSLTTKANSDIVVKAGATIDTLVLSGADKAVSLKINGKVEKIVIEQKSDLSITGTTTDTVAIENNAANTTITSAVPADITLNADADIVLEEGAEGTTITTGSSDVTVDVVNNTTGEVVVTDEAGNETSVAAGETAEDATADSDESTGDDSSSDDSSSSNDSSSSSSSSSSSGSTTYTGGTSSSSSSTGTTYTVSYVNFVSVTMVVEITTASSISATVVTSAVVYCIWDEEGCKTEGEIDSVDDILTLLNSLEDVTVHVWDIDETIEGMFDVIWTDFAIDLNNIEYDETTVYLTGTFTVPDGWVMDGSETCTTYNQSIEGTTITIPVFVRGYNK